MRVVEFPVERRAVLLGVCHACGPHRIIEARATSATWYRWCHRCHAFFRPAPERVTA